MPTINARGLSAERETYDTAKGPASGGHVAALGTLF
jgi:hypothetical protein